MLNSLSPDLIAGGHCSFPLPSDPSCASVTRSALTIVMNELGLPSDLIDDGALAVSELATNQLLHAPGSTAELWTWIRTARSPHLVVAVFDTAREALPVRSDEYLLDEHGRGLAIVAALAASVGAHPSRSRLQADPVTGKAVWFTLPLPQPWLGTRLTPKPLRASQQLLLALRSRGLPAKHKIDDHGTTTVHLDRLRVDITRDVFLWCTDDGLPVRYPLLDLQDTVEAIIQQIDTSH
ncbi:ATP-binding protein [Spirillospora sp. NPDC052269]